jgi:hypothetical protein
VAKPARSLLEVQLDLDRGELVELSSLGDMLWQAPDLVAPSSQALSVAVADCLGRSGISARSAVPLIQ